MPEGDTIFRTARTLERALAGRVLTGFQSTDARLLRCNDDAPFAGQTVTQVESRGKWLLIHFSGGGILVTHMLMNGSWHIYRPGERWHKPHAQMRIVLENSEYLAVGFQIPVIEMHTANSIKRNRRIPTPTHDVLSEAFDSVAAVEALLERKDEAIADLLLDQRILAGVGNEFKSEICFIARVNPFEPVAALGRGRAEKIVATAQKLLHANVLEESKERAFTYRGAWRRTTHASDPHEHAWVYERAGQPCRRCGRPVECRLQGANARLTFWCPQCQPSHGDSAFKK